MVVRCVDCGRYSNIVKIVAAVRTQKLQILGDLSTDLSSKNLSHPPGVACIVQPVMPILDMLYSSRLVLGGLAQRYGRVPQKWPPAVVAQLRQRHDLLVQRIQRVICSLSSASYFVLGRAPSNL